MGRCAPAALDRLAGAGRGRVDFTIDRFLKSGILKVKLNSNQLDIQALKKGDNTIHFEAGDVKEGANTIRFSGSGSWGITSVKVGYET